MVKKDSNEGGGFARYWQENGSILLPLATIAAIKAEAEAALEAADIAFLEEAEAKKKGSYRSRKSKGQNACSKRSRRQTRTTGR